MKTMRSFFDSQIEVRDDGNGRKILGYAVVYESFSRDFGQISGAPEKSYEVISRGALDTVLASKPDVLALYNHDVNMVLGRSSNGTLRLWSDSTGLGYEIKPPNTTYANDFMISLERGDVGGSSFGFRPRKGGYVFQRGNDGEAILRINDIMYLRDVGPVATPMYPETAASLMLRSEMESYWKSKDEEEALRIENYLKGLKRKLRLKEVQI